MYAPLTTMRAFRHNGFACFAAKEEEEEEKAWQAHTRDNDDDDGAVCDDVTLR